MSTQVSNDVAEQFATAVRSYVFEKVNLDEMCKDLSNQFGTKVVHGMGQNNDLQVYTVIDGITIRITLAAIAN